MHDEDEHAMLSLEESRCGDTNDDVVSRLSSQKSNGVTTIDDEMRNNIPIVCKRERAMTERDIEARSY